MKFHLNFISILLILTIILTINSFKCGADNLKLNPYNIEIPKEEERRRLDSSYYPIRIGGDFSSFNKPSRMSNELFSKIKSLITETFNEFPKFLKVQRPNLDLSGELRKIKEYCDLDTVGSNYANFLIDNDVIVFPSFNNDLNEQVIAAAGFCLTYGERPHPVGGVLYINPNLSFDMENMELYMKNVLFHEITHILVFSPNLFNSLGMLSSGKNKVYYIVSENALLKARQHFNCGSLYGIPLENQGGEGSVGSHWESRYMLGDYMISTDYADLVISDITLALFEDTGYYKVDYYSGGLFKFGKNKGCQFLNEKCIKNGEPLTEEFCVSPYKPMCTQSRTVKGYCAIYDYSSSGLEIPEEYQYFSNENYGGFSPVNFCPVPMQSDSEIDYFPDNCKVGTSILSPEYGEKMGDSSFCFVSSLLPSSSRYNVTERPICYEVECNNYDKTIVVNIGSLTVECPTSGGNITNIEGFKGNIICPKYIDICDFKSNNICNEMFECLSKKVQSDEDSYMYDPTDDNFIRVDRSYLSGKNIIINKYIFFLLLLSYIFNL